MEGEGFFRSVMRCFLHDTYGERSFAVHDGLGCLTEKLKHWSARLSIHVQSLHVCNTCMIKQDISGI